MRVLIGFSVILVACASSGGAVAPPAHDDALADGLPVTRLACPPSRGDCDGDSSNGCESDLSADPLNCRACGHACSTDGGLAVCIGGRCGGLR
ncbi:MAG TPA: hypothetical protein VF765_00995 [Polyangiaceae bacterium]